MNESTISDNLRHLLKMHDSLSVSELARQTQIPQPTLHHILNGVTKKPRQEVLNSLAKYFSISIPQLTGAVPLHQSIPGSLKECLKITTIPIIDWSQVSHWHQIENRPQDSKEIILDRQVDTNSFALIMRDSSMEPLFPEKSILIFDPSKKPKDRDFALIQLNKQSSIYFNRLFIDGTDFFIKENQADGNAKLIRFKPNHDRIIATLVEVRLQF